MKLIEAPCPNVVPCPGKTDSCKDPDSGWISETVMDFLVTVDSATRREVGMLLVFCPNC